MFCCIRGENEEREARRVKMVVVGDGDCGKTCLLYRFLYDQFFTRYIPTVFEVESKTVYYKDTEVNLLMYDTAGQEDYDRLRPFSYDETDVMVVCYSVDNPDSLDNVLLNWVPEVRYFCGNIPLLLVATKTDMRQSAHDTQLLHMASIKNDELLHTAPVQHAELLHMAPKHSEQTSDSNQFSDMVKPRKRQSKTTVTYAEGKAVATKMGAVGYFETSSKTGEGTDALFEAVVRAGMDIKQKSRRGLFGLRKK